MASRGSVDAEAVILAVGPDSDIGTGFKLPAPYCFRIGGEPSGDAERDLRAGHGQIVAIFASLGGRAELDLYRPGRGSPN